jgi:hypothetical protein
MSSISNPELALWGVLSEVEVEEAKAAEKEAFNK